MKVIGIVGNPRKNDNTELLTAHTLRAIAEEGLDVKLVSLADLDIRPCNDCRICYQDERCSI
jgi:multimeric flavodoxin WrbA